MVGMMVDLELPKERTIIANAPLWKRTAAFFLDILLIQIIIVGPFTGIIESKIPLSDDFMANYNYFQAHPELVGELSIILGIIFFLAFAFFIIFEYRMRQTPGKMLLNIHVAPENRNEDITFFKIVIRNLVFIPIIPFTLLWIVDPLYLLFTGRRLSDVISKTMVVEEVRI
jgi:uncharacterized RDD family membrane protein YckC